MEVREEGEVRESIGAVASPVYTTGHGDGIDDERLHHLETGGLG